MAEIMQQPQNPDDLARLAGKQMYGTPVGMLRRVELFRLGNAWGHKFPDGATKDSMLPFFKELEAQGKNPLAPPTGSLDQVVKTREVEHEGKPAYETVEELAPLEVPDEIKPAPVSDFEMKLLNTPHAQLKKICKMKGIRQERNDSSKTLVARIMAAAGATPTVE